MNNNIKDFDKVIRFCETIMLYATQNEKHLQALMNEFILSGTGEIQLRDTRYNEALKTIQKKYPNKMKEIRIKLINLKKNMDEKIFFSHYIFLVAQSLKNELIHIKRGVELKYQGLIEELTPEHEKRARWIEEAYSTSREYSDNFKEGYATFIKDVLRAMDEPTVSIAAVSSTPSAMSLLGGPLASIPENNENANKGGTRRRRNRQTKRSKRSKRSKRTCRNRS